MNQDAEHLNLLSIFYYIIGGLTLLAALVVMIKVGMLLLIGSIFSQMPPEPASKEMPDIMAGMGTGMLTFGIIFGLLALALITVGVCQIVTGRNLKVCRSIMFCQVIAGITCVCIPMGTILGVFTFVVLSRPSVIALFQPKRTEYGL